MGFALLASSHVAAEPHADIYQLRFPPPQKTGALALADFHARADVVYASIACSREIRFLDLAKAKKADEDTLTIVLAKMIVYTGWPNRTERDGDRFLCKAVDRFRGKPPDGPTLSKQIEAQFGSVCANAVQSTNTDGDFAEIHYGLTRDCLRKQVNDVINQIEVKGTIGSTGLVCWPPAHGLFVTEGEWHITVRDLTRIYYINDQTGRSALDESVRIKIRNDLLTIDGRPGPESYNIGQCGDQEKSTGSPEERAQEDDWLDNAMDDVGDALDWLWKWLSRILPLVIALAIAGPVLVAVFGAIGAAAVIVLAVAGGIALTFGTIPETENHRLMIESDRYLNNQIILAEIDPSNSHRHNFVSDQQEVREWLLKRLQRIAKEEFVEYNARAYQRYSMHAIRSLYDFARDHDIVMAAGNVLDIASAKMAIGSNQGRRLVPYRRLMENLPRYIELNTSTNADGTRKFFNGLMDLESGSDHQIAAMLLYAGQTQQAPSGRVSYSAAAEMVYIASSRYRPPVAVVDLAVDKTHAYQQRFKHDGVEIYSSAPGYLLTAGGIRSGPSSTIEIAGISPGGSILGIIPLANNKDRGAAVPTTLMLTGGGGRSSLERFLHIAGRRDVLDSDNATYDHNVCVWRGFACGINVRTPPDMQACFNHRPPGAPGQWSFFDTDACPGFGGGPRVMIARYLETCHGDQTGDCVDNVGLFEAVSDPGVSFDQFQQTVVQNNPGSAQWLGLIGGLFAAGRTVLSGTYKSFSGESIEFDTSGHQLDSDDTGIVRVNGNGLGDLDDWARASGDVMSGDRDKGRFKFVNPNDGHGFSIDMSNWNAPTRQDF